MKQQHLRYGFSYDWAREVDFPQINIDLIAGMMGESEERWRETVRRAIELEPDSVSALSAAAAAFDPVSAARTLFDAARHRVGR